MLELNFEILYFATSTYNVYVGYIYGLWLNGHMLTKTFNEKRFSPVWHLDIVAREFIHTTPHYLRRTDKI